MKLAAAGLLLAAGFAALPLITERNDLLNLGLQICLAIVLAQSWNLLGGYAGQINLGHAAFFGIGALVTRVLWVGEIPLPLALAAGALAATVFGFVIGLLAFRLRGAYFAIGTLGLAEILRITMGNLLPEISTISAAELGSYNMLSRYYLTFGLALLSIVVVALIVLKDSPIQTLYDLKGKRVVTGDRGWGTTVLAEAMMSAAGMPPEDAHLVAELLVRSDLRGIETHGVRWLPNYCAGLAAGRINPRPMIRIDGYSGTLLMVDGVRACWIGARAVEPAQT